MLALSTVNGIIWPIATTRSVQGSFQRLPRVGGMEGVKEGLIFRVTCRYNIANCKPDAKNRVCRAHTNEVHKFSVRPEVETSLQNHTLETLRLSPV